MGLVSGLATHSTSSSALCRGSATSPQFDTLQMLGTGPSMTNRSFGITAILSLPPAGFFMPIRHSQFKVNG
ncbi:hypothetical protein AGR6A_Cc80224 [Agrobacterium sp. NCPPB 925]|nr:hypothetical protein AGR6A_Cc80224 [Agrobacterium sp. NCPPB 925]